MFRQSDLDAFIASKVVEPQPKLITAAPKGKERKPARVGGFDFDAWLKRGEGSSKERESELWRSPEKART